MNILRTALLSVSIILSSTGIAQASPIRLDYAVNDMGGGLFDYEFSLVLDNNDNSWAPGQGWRWLIFGDAPYPSSSPLTDFVGDLGDLPIGPWTGYGASSGGHNGPDLQSVLDYWVPTSIGETLSWSGTSTANLAQGDLLFSTIAGTLNNAIAADFEVANRIDYGAQIPEPSGIALLAMGLMALGLSKRRANI